MTEELLLINPTHRRKRKKTVARRKNPVARRRAPAKRRRRNPVPARASSHSSYLTNPRRRKRKTYRKRRSNPSPRRTGIQGMLNTQIIPAAVAGSGALALDVIMGYLPLPVELKIGPGRYLVKGAGAILMGMAAEMLVAKSTARQLATGALTVVMHDAMKEATIMYAPNIPLGEYVSGMGEYVSGYPGELSPDGFGKLGYYSAAQPVGVPSNADNGYEYTM